MSTTGAQCQRGRGGTQYQEGGAQFQGRKAPNAKEGKSSMPMRGGMLNGKGEVGGAYCQQASITGWEQNLGILFHVIIGWSFSKIGNMRNITI